MREGDTFHDGTPVDAAAVKKDLDAIRTSVLTWSTFAPIRRSRSTAPLTLDVAMKIPWSAFPASLTAQSGMVAAPKQLDDTATGTRQPVGSGPFVFESWTPDSLLHGQEEHELLARRACPTSTRSTSARSPSPSRSTTRCARATST